jgi:WD40 repeat protein
MKYIILALLCGVFLLGIVVPAAGAVTPSWIQKATTGGDLSGVVISEDGRTIITGGAQLMSLTTAGQKRWSGWSGTHLDISSDGDYILTSQGPEVRLFSGAGAPLWDQSMDTIVTDLSIASNASTIAANGGGKLRTVTLTGEGIASNTSLSVNHIRILPSGQILATTNKDAEILDSRLLPVWSDTTIPMDLIAVDRDGSSFVTATNNRVRMYEGNGNLTWDKKLSGENVQALAISRDGSTIILGTDNNNIEVLTPNGVQAWSANATDWISSVAVSDDGNTIVAGSLDKKMYVFNHAGTKLGTFTAENSIRANSVAVTGDGSLIVLVDSSAVYGFARSLFIEQATAGETITGPSPEETLETSATTLPVTTTRKVTRTPTLPTPYPTDTETPEAALPAAVPLAALGLLYLCRSGKT